MFSWRNKKDISIFRMKKAPYLLLSSRSQICEPQPEKMNLLTYAHKKDSNQQVHQCILIRVSIVCMKKLCILGYPKCAHWRFWSDCTNAQADLNRCCALMSKGVFLQLWLIYPQHKQKVASLQSCRQKLSSTNSLVTDKVLFFNQKVW